MSSGASSENRENRPSRIAEYFGRLASTYGDGAYYGIRRRAVLGSIASELARSRAVLDVGCGNGTYLAEFAEAVGVRRLVGADLTAAMLLEARRRTPAKCSLVCADAWRLPFRARAFDFVFASHVLPFVADLDETVAEIARCLAPGGLLVATRQGGDSTIRRAMAGIIGKERWNDFAMLVMRTAPRDNPSTAPDDRYRSAFAKAGLEVEERVAPFQIMWRDVEEWIGIRWMPVIPEDERPRARRMLAEVARAAAGARFPLHEPIMLGRKRA
ncbi:MAG TPA: class I SAM-dependent methyltransferase [Candidatus Acidoferrales bacterium]|nr:class I SAM-dependent methyltransferase [Candidatus Acidoferrales bacterium]